MTLGKTLKELNVQAGDKVISVNNTYEKYGVFTCTGVSDDKSFWPNDRYLDNHTYGKGLFGDSDGMWVIVSRAATDANKVEEGDTMNDSNDIKVGDKVNKLTLNGKWSETEHTVLYIHHVDPNRKYYVVAYMGDIPESYPEGELRKAPPKIVAHSNKMYSDTVSGKLYNGSFTTLGFKEVRASYNTIDGVVELSSYKITPA